MVEISSMAFTRWSTTNPSAAEILRPDLGLRAWGNLTSDQKGTIWKNLIKLNFFEKDEVILGICVDTFPSK